MRWAPLIAAVTLARAAAPDSAAIGALPQEIREISLDPASCYRVSDLALGKEDARLYFTHGHLILATPVAGHRIAAVFSGEIEGGDGEILLFPPSRAERQSLAVHTGSPNLNEHFSAAVLLFSDDTGRQLESLISEGERNRKDEERGAALSKEWTPVLRNIASSFESRLLLDLYSGQPDRFGVFTAVLSGKTLGNFDLWHDPRAREQMVAGQISSREGRSVFEVWTSFETRQSRSSRRAPAEPELRLSDYRIDAAVEPDLTLKVATRITVTPAAAARNVAPFEMSTNMRMLSATIDGEPAAVLQRDSVRSNLIRNSSAELVLVIPPRPLTPGRAYQFEMHSEGKVIDRAGDGVYYVGARSSWYPSRGTQFAAYDLTFRYPKNLQLVTPGEIVDDDTEGDWRITRRRTPAIRIAGFNLGDYEHTRVTRGAYSVDVYANRSLEQALQARAAPPPLIPPPSVPWARNRRGPPLLQAPIEPPPPRPTARLQALAADIGSAFEFLAARFGPPATNLLTVAPVPGRFGQGFPGLVYLSTLSYLGPQGKRLASLDERQTAFFSDLLQAHETAHQWWGNVVTAEGYRDNWIMEALANYSALLYLEKQKGARPLESALAEYRSQLLERATDGQTIESSGPIVLGGRLLGAAHPDAWRRITYGKGSWILHMLRRRMGDEAFWAMLAALRKRFERKAITTDDFRLLAAGFLPPRSHDPKLEAFFEQWVYGSGIPRLEFKHSLKGKLPSLRVTGMLAQGEVDAEYVAEIPVEIQFRRGKPLTVWLPASGEPAPFTIPVREAPSRVVVNPGNAVLVRD
jgi:hypothetical protein